MLHSFWYEKPSREFAAVAKRSCCGMALLGNRHDALSSNLGIFFFFFFFIFFFFFCFFFFFFLLFFFFFICFCFCFFFFFFFFFFFCTRCRSPERGSEAVAKARLRSPNTTRRDYIAAIETFYRIPTSCTIAPCSGMKKPRAAPSSFTLYERRLFSMRLAVQGTASTTDKTYPKHQKSVAILEKILAEQPDHPVSSYTKSTPRLSAACHRALAVGTQLCQDRAGSRMHCTCLRIFFTRLGLVQGRDRIQPFFRAAGLRKYMPLGKRAHRKIPALCVSPGSSGSGAKVVDAALAAVVIRSPIF